MSSSGATEHSGQYKSVQILEVGEPNHSQRLDNYLLGKLKGAPKTLIYRIIRKGEVRVNSKRAKADTRLQQGDKVRVPPLRLTEQGEVALPGEQLQQKIRSAVLFEDDSLLVLNKFSGIAVHAGTGGKLGIIETLRSIYPQLPGLELVHRLDKGTSGCLLLAKTGKARRTLMNDFREHRVTKIYHLLVAGQWPKHVSRVELSLQRQNERNGERLVEVDAEGKSACTDFRVLSLYKQACLLEARPSTGRTHQIRVHATETGCPLLGDDKYFSAQSQAMSSQLKVKRLCLHAAQLEFKHPESSKLLSIKAPYDESFNRVIETLQTRG